MLLSPWWWWWLPSWSWSSKNSESATPTTDRSFVLARATVKILCKKCRTASIKMKMWSWCMPLWETRGYLTGNDGSVTHLRAAWWRSASSEPSEPFLQWIYASAMEMSQIKTSNKIRRNNQFWKNLTYPSKSRHLRGEHRVACNFLLHSWQKTLPEIPMKATL